MAQGAVLIGVSLLAGALLAASSPWSRDLPKCSDVPAAQRELVRLAGRCEGSAPIVNVSPGAVRKQPNASGATAPRRPVPDLRGHVFNRQDERLARYVVAIDYLESAQRRDWVIDQVPRPPAVVPDGASLRVVLSDGALVRVPDVRGNYARALALLYRAGLKWSSGDGNAGRIVGQVPGPGVAVRPGTEVLLRVSAGRLALAPESTRPEVVPAPAPTAPPPATPPAGTAPAPASTVPAPASSPATAPPTLSTPPNSSTMPDVQGMNFDVARQRLSGFNVQRLHRGGTEPGGTVIGQSPAAGSPLTPGASVRLVLSDGSLVRVPRVMSFTLTEARQRLMSGELRAVITNVPSDATAGTVVGQQPAEGQIAQRGATIRLSVSSGPAARPTLTLPNVVGVPFERARSQFGRLKVERSQRPAREPAGTILEQTPAPGTVVEPGSTVSIVVSSGGRPETIELQNIVGQGVDAATAALSEFRLERDTVPSIEPGGRVLTQDPPAGASIAPGSTVHLRISDGSRVRVPSLANMTLAQARQAADAGGLQVVLEGSNAGTAAPEAIVMRQAPAAGAEAARGSALQLVVEDVSPLAAAQGSVRGLWTRASAEFSPRTLVVGLIVLLALLALLLLSRRRPRETYYTSDPVLAPAPEPTPEPTPKQISEPPAVLTPKHISEPPVPKAERVSVRASETARTPETARTYKLTRPPEPIPERFLVPPPESTPAPEPDLTHESTRGATSEQASGPTPERIPQRTPEERPSKAISRQGPVLVPGHVPVSVPVVDGVQAPVRVPIPESLRRPQSAPRAPVAPPPAREASPPDPVVFGASARLDADPDATLSTNAVPRGPVIQLSARLESGESAVRELAAETANDEITETNR